ncbi:hypothetical protein HDF16_003483 [Granulicella aggregans]|uniref:PPM-type phosphatase domain-containing protein n=1 Tax=Granulicella aggregans TaxID=474949 RepID=A0A7W7ZFR4_9BACT|nr:PP2C family protein-serine/threonine phosphatase [Granulicella aggregans]MBB5058769.1 hypothetical protein [Granulicella aggregans]
MSQPVDLGGTWLVHAGDDPAYAQAGFDDSGWTPFNSHAALGSLFPNTHPDIVWYRLRVKVSPDQVGLALREQSISRAFEIYLNGERFISSGQVAPYAPYTKDANLLKHIPDATLAMGSLVIAIRVHIARTEWNSTNPGYYPSNLRIGQAAVLQQQDGLTMIGEGTVGWLDTLLLAGVGFVALMLFAAQRRQSEYLWIFALGLIRLAQAPFQIVFLFRNVPAAWEVLSRSFTVLSPIAWVSMYFAFVHQKIGWKFRIYLVLAGLLNAYSSMNDLVPILSGVWGLAENLPFVTLLSVVIPVVLIVHMRRGNREAGILLIPVVLFSLYIYAKFGLLLLYRINILQGFVFRGLNLIDNYHAGPFVIGLDPLAGIFSTLSLAVIMVLRATSMSRRQALIEGELAAAQQVQQILLPEHTGSVPGFVIESAYQPAQQVGGDFFQILPTAENGLMLVVGDVAGKGLPAAMMVSLLVGSIRTAAEDSDAPDLLLYKLNERLVGRSGGGFSTALAAHIAADGTVTLANAGHLPPYLDGLEIAMPGALPLGLVSGIRYETMQFHLAPGSRMTFYSDGVVEAQNQRKELFGFERGREFSTHSAQAIVAAAMLFGQSDDITVVAITRGPALAT